MAEAQHFTKRQIARRARRGLRTIDGDRQDPSCPLRWTCRVGREVATTPEILSSYLQWLGRAKPMAS